MIEAKSFFWDKLQAAAENTDSLNNFIATRVDQALENTDDPHQWLLAILKQREQIIIDSPRIQELSEDIKTQIVVYVGSKIWNIDGIEHCFQWLTAISKVLFIIFFNQIVLQHAEELDYLNLSHMSEPRDDQYTTRVRLAKTKNNPNWSKKVATSFWKKRSQADALREHLWKRGELLWELQEYKLKKEASKPKLQICRRLAKRHILYEYETGKFRIRWMRIGSSQAETTTRDLFIENDEIGVHTSRSLNKHTFKGAYKEILNMIIRKVAVTPAEIKELEKCNNPFVYTNLSQK